jgi:hypothetical protein
VTFALDLDKFAKKTSAKADLVVRKIVLDVGTALVMKSPVGDASYWTSPPPPGYVGGRFRANWQYGDNEIPNGQLSAIDVNGGATIGAINNSLKPNATGKLHYLVNNLPYAQRLEDGWSRQCPPNGMVGLTVKEFRPIVSAAAKALK